MVSSTAIPQLEKLGLRLWKVLANLANFDSVFDGHHEFRVRERCDLVDERHVVFDRFRELDDSAHDIDVPWSVLDVGRAIEDVGRLVGSEVRAVILVVEKFGIFWIEVGHVAAIDARARRESEACGEDAE
jgi:hypothetical protein